MSSHSRKRSISLILNDKIQPAAIFTWYIYLQQNDCSFRITVEPPNVEVKLWCIACPDGTWILNLEPVSRLFDALFITKSRKVLNLIHGFPIYIYFGKCETISMDSNFTCQFSFRNSKWSTKKISKKERKLFFNCFKHI